MRRWETIDLWLDVDDAAPLSLNRGVRPIPRYAHSMSLDGQRRALMVFGGSGSLYLNDLLEIDMTLLN